MSIEPVDQYTIIGRSSSHFTRVTRIFAAELGIPCALQVVPNLLSCDAADYGGNPALKLPALKTAEGVWYGALNVCRTLARAASSRPASKIVWPEDLVAPRTPPRRSSAWRRSVSSASSRSRCSAS